MSLSSSGENLSESLKSPTGGPVPSGPSKKSSYKGRETQPSKGPKGSKDSIGGSRNKTSDGKKKKRELTIRLNNNQRDEAAVVESWGANVQFGDTNAVTNPHVLAASSRTVIMHTQCYHKMVEESKHVVILDPRDGEVKFFKDYLGNRVYSKRDALHGSDAAEQRVIHNTDPWLRNTVYICNDNLYWATPESMFKDYGFLSHPDMAGRGVNCLVSLFDFRGEGECLFLHRFQLNAQESRDVMSMVWRPARAKDGTVQLDGDGDVVTERVQIKQEIPRTPAVDILEGLAIKKGGVIEYHASVGSMGSDTRYVHPWHADAFFEYSQYVFVYAGRLVQMVTHVETRVGWRTLINVNFSFAKVGSESVRMESVPHVGFVTNGRINALVQLLRPKALGVDRTLVSSIRNYLREGVECYYRLLPHKFEPSLTFISESLTRCMLTSIDYALYQGKVYLQPNVVRNGVKQAVDKYRSLEYQKKLDCSPETGDMLVAVTSEQNRASLLVELYLIVKRLGVRFTNWLQNLILGQGNCSGLINLDLLSCLQEIWRNTGIKRPLKKITHVVINFGWLNNLRMRSSSWAANYPKMMVVLEWGIDVALIFLKAFVEEWAKRKHGSVFLLFALIEAGVDLISLIYGDNFQMERLAEFFSTTLIRVFLHGLLTLLPLPVAVIAHALWNMRTQENCLHDFWNFVSESALEQMWDEAELGATGSDIEMKELSKNLLVRSRSSKDSQYAPLDAQFVPLVDQPELCQELARVHLPSRKRVVLDCAASRMFARPCGTALEMARMVLVRLEAPVPQADSAGIRAGYKQAHRLIFHLFRPVEPMALEAFKFYILQQGFSTSKEMLYLERLRELEADGAYVGKTREMVGKTDEILPIKEDLSGANATKMRPIFPINTGDLDLMRWLLPFKTQFGVPVEGILENGTKYTFTYLLNTRADALDTWINFHCVTHGIHIVMLGDDNLTMFVGPGFEGRSALAMAYDLKSCDLTCGLEIQLCWADLMRRGGASDAVCHDFLTACWGTRAVSVKGAEDLDLEFRWIQKLCSTITGGPATSLQAVFAQYCFLSPALVRWAYTTYDGPLLGFRRFMCLVAEHGRHNGHILEFETGSDGSHLGPVWTRTFLGGIFMWDEDDSLYKWCPHNFLKSAFIFPLTEKIYQTSNHIGMHCAAVSQDAGLRRTPLGGKICSVFDRLARESGLKNSDFELALQTFISSKSWYDKLKLGKLSLAPISEHSWLRCLTDFNRVRGFRDPCAEYFSLMEELDTVTTLPHKLGTKCRDLCFVQRFGNGATQDIELDVLKALGRLSGIRDSNYIESDKYKKFPTLEPMGQKGKETPKAQVMKKISKLNTQERQLAKQVVDRAIAKKKAQISKSGGSAKTKNAWGIGYKNGGLSGYWDPTKNGFHGEMPAQMHRTVRSPKEDTREVFDEFVATVNGSVAYTYNSYDMNPGLVACFPITSATAKNYARYKPRSLIWYFRPLVTEFTSAGRVIISADIDMENAPPVTQVDQENNTIRKDCMPHQELDMEVAGVLRHQDSWFTRTQNYPPGADCKSFDLGRLFVGTYGQANTNPIGELRVRGCFDFMDKLLDPIAIPFVYHLSHYYCYTDPALTTGVTALVPWYKVSSDPDAHSAHNETFLYPGATQWVVSGSSSGATVTCNQPGFYRIVARVLIIGAAATTSSAATQLDLTCTSVAYGTRAVTSYFPMQNVILPPAAGPGCTAVVEASLPFAAGDSFQVQVTAYFAVSTMAIYGGHTSLDITCLS